MTLRNALDDLATEVRPADLAPRVTAGLRRRRQRRVGALAGATVAVVAVAAVTVVSRDPGGSGVTARPADRLRFSVAWVEAYSHDDGELFAVPEGGGQPVSLGRMRPTAIDLSPDGRRIAVVNGPKVEVVSTDGTRRTLDVDLTRRDGVRPSVVWAPDSRRLAVADVTPIETTPGAEIMAFDGAWVADVETGRVDHVAHPTGGGQLAWLPDGQTLLLPRPPKVGGAMGFDVVTLDGRLVRSLGADKAWYLRTSHPFSPDGTRLLITSAEGGGPSMAVVDAVSGAELHSLYPDQYVWQDATHLVRHRGDEMGRDVVVVTLDGAVVRDVFAFPGTEDYSPGEVALRPAS